MNRLIWSNLAAQLAEQISLAAIPLVAVLAFGAGAGETGVLQTAQTLPFLLFALPVGLLADRLSRTRLMVSGARRCAPSRCCASRRSSSTAVQTCFCSVCSACSGPSALWPPPLRPPPLSPPPPRRGGCVLP